MEFKDYYKILSVAKSANADEIKKAFRRLARKYHPDVSKESDANVRMAELNEANAVLSDPEKRLAYDTLANQPHAQPGHDFQPPPHWDAGFEFTDSHTDSGEHSDFFEQLFGRAARSQRSDKRGNDHHAKIELNIMDAYDGAERMLSLRSARLDETGRVISEERQLQVTIPKGVFEGQHIRLAGRGGLGLGGAASGDLLLEVLFMPDSRWRAQGRDVFQPVALAPWEAMLGTTATIATPGGQTEVTIPAGSKAGRKLRLKGRGIPGKTPGDLFLELGIALPVADNDAARAAYAAMAKAFPLFAPRGDIGASS